MEKEESEEEDAGSESDDDDDDDIPYNPKNLPLGWDGKVE
jgi:splicing factor 3A subunit 3